MTLTGQSRRIVAAMLADPTGEFSGLDIARLARLPSGTIYPALARLENAGWICARWASPSSETQHRRRFYRLTGYGATAARATLAPPDRSRRRSVAGPVEVQPATS
jgi:PadR family transcriptional regulator, regulatory protein PadR